MLSLILRMIFFSSGQKKFVRPFVSVNSFLLTFLLFLVLKTLYKFLIFLHTCSDLCVQAEQTGQEIMRALSMCIRNWCASWPYASAP
jgi:hypothetical protein